MKQLVFFAAITAIAMSVVQTAAFAVPTADATAPVDVRVRDTRQGPKLFVDGKAVRPRFFYGSPANLSIIFGPRKTELVIPFKADCDTASGKIEIEVSDEDDPARFSNARLTDLTSGRTQILSGTNEVCTRNFAFDELRFEKSHDYRFSVFHRATRSRVYPTHRVSYVDHAGNEKTIPLPYGDTLGDTVRLAAAAEVDLVTFSTDNSWGCVDWWAPPGAPRAYDRIDAMCASLIAANPRVLLVPRVSANAPRWMIKEDPSIRMKFDSGFTIEMSSVSARSYRKSACEEIERLARHLQKKFPRNFAGLHVSGQNSAEWFYMLSQTANLSGYDVHTRDAFRNWLAARGAKDAATADVPSPAQRRVRRPGGRLDPVLDRRVLEFGRFRQEEMASFINELGAAVRRGTGGKSLSLFFYGYTWEVGSVMAGAAETGHFYVDWLLKNARENIDGISAPMSYVERRWPGSFAVMSAAETISRHGLLWINEDDTRTHLEDLWTFPIKVGGFINRSPDVTRDSLLRNGAVNILRGHGDWWMDLCGRGWFRDEKLWDIRRSLNEMDDALLRRRRAYSPEIALVADEESLLMNGWGSSPSVSPFLNRIGFETCGAPYGQYLLDDVLENPPPSAKLVFVAYARDLSPAKRAKLEALKQKGVRVFEATKRADLSPASIAAQARAAGVHLYAPAGRAVLTAAEGFVVVQARRDGPIDLNFGAAPVVDFLSGETVSDRPAVSLRFRKGETRIFRVPDVTAAKPGVVRSERSCPPDVQKQ